MVAVDSVATETSLIERFKKKYEDSQGIKIANGTLGWVRTICERVEEIVKDQRYGVVDAMSICRGTDLEVRLPGWFSVLRESIAEQFPESPPPISGVSTMFGLYAPSADELAGGKRPCENRDSIG